MMTKEEYQKTLIRMWDSVREDKNFSWLYQVYSAGFMPLC